LPLRLDFVVKLKCQTGTIVLSLGIKYSMRDLICDAKYYAWVSKTTFSTNIIWHVICGK